MLHYARYTWDVLNNICYAFWDHIWCIQHEIASRTIWQAVSKPVMGALLAKRSGATAPSSCKKIERRSRSRSFIIKGARYHSRSSKKWVRSFWRSFPKTIERKLYNNGLYIFQTFLIFVIHYSQVGQNRTKDINKGLAQKS